MLAVVWYFFLLLVQEETVTEEAKFSSTARDLIDLVVVVRRSCDVHVTSICDHQ